MLRNCIVPVGGGGVVLLSNALCLNPFFPFLMGLGGKI